MSRPQEYRENLPERSNLPYIDSQSAKNSYTAGFSQHNDGNEHGKNAVDQSRSIPSSSLVNNRQSVCDIRSDLPSPTESGSINDHSHESERSKHPAADRLRKSTLEPERKANEVEVSTTAGASPKAPQNECDLLRARIIELQNNLQDAQDFIFSLQPRQQKFTETEAAADFSTLCGSIEEWVDRKLGEALDDKILTKEKPTFFEPSNMLLSLIPYPGKEAFKYPETDEYNITAAIMQFLSIEIFNKEFYCPIGDREIEFMLSIEKSMRNLEPRRDVITCRTWRSETYTAIANRQEFSQLCERRKDILIQLLSDMLGLFIPRAHTGKLQASIRNAIIEPAFALAHRMHLSVDHFRIEWSQYHAMRTEQRQPFTGEFADFELVDLLASGKTLKHPPLHRIEYILDITPQLVFRRVKADAYAEPKVLKKPKILVAVAKEGHHEKSEAGLRPVFNATVLGWLDLTVHAHKRHGLSKR